MEKARIYRARKNELYVIEKRPSLQETYQEKVYNSLYIRSFAQPLKNVVDLAKVLLCSYLIICKLKVRPSFVYAYNQDPENVIVAYSAKLILRVPMVILYHHISQRSLSDIRVGIKNRRASGYSLVSSVWRSLVPWINYKCAKRADVHLSLSKATADEVKEVLGVTKCEVIGNGVDTNRFKEMALEKIYEAAFLGRIVPQKGIDVLLRAWSLVVKTLPNAKLLLIGGADRQKLKDYEVMVKSLGLTGSVTFTGFVDDELLVRLLNQSKLFVFPSRREGFAQAVSQAMACGLCCILSDLPSLREVYADAAVYFPPEDYEELSRLITLYLRDDLARLTFGKKAKERVRGMLWDEVVEREISAISSFRRQPI
ncbi:MAG: glycosyltransferase family 4 protein [Conexivisphaerales archaeon]